jgi:hypothetical protein
MGALGGKVLEFTFKFSKKVINFSCYFAKRRRKLIFVLMTTFHTSPSTIGKMKNKLIDFLHQRDKFSATLFSYIYSIERHAHDTIELKRVSINIHKT